MNVYFNLHKKVWSVRQGSAVIGHVDRIFLRDVNFRVQKAGRAKVLKEKRKNVHAYASGYICDEQDVPNIPNRINSVTYNPYKYETFVYEQNGKPCLHSDYAELTIVKGREKNRGKVEGIWE